MAPGEPGSIGPSLTAFLLPGYRGQYRAAREASSGSSAVIMPQVRASRSANCRQPEPSRSAAAASSSMALVSRVATSAADGTGRAAGQVFEHTLEL